MKKIEKIILALAVVVGATSCTDWLDTKPYSSLETSVAISNLKDAQVALYGVYDAMQTSDYYGRNFVVIPDAAADNVVLKPANSGRFLAELNWTVLPTTGEPTGVWVAAYQTIDRANNIIANIDGVAGDEATRNQIKGEAIMLRALAHFDLVRMFAQPYNYTSDHSHLGVPYMLVSEISSPKRLTVGEDYDKIVTDLSDAATLMTIQPATPTTVSSWAAKALLAKVYLYMEDWPNARTMAEDIIAHGPYVLTTNADYPTMFTNEFSSESIFELQFTSVDNNATNQLGYIYQSQGYGDLWPSQDLLDSYDAGDIRLGWFYTSGGDVYTKKFIGKNASKPGQEVNTPILRLSDMYLVAAEAEAELTNDVIAQGYLDAIVQRALPTAADITLTGDALKARIQLERRKELAFEGNRLYDLTRRKLGVVRGSDCTSTFCTIDYPSTKFAYPIPQIEIDANPNMVQNPGYGN